MTPVTQENAQELLVEAIERVLLDQNPTARKYRRLLQRITDAQGFLDIQLLLPGQEITKATQGVYLRYGEHLADLLSNAQEMPRSQLSLGAFHNAYESIPVRPARYSSHYNPFEQLPRAEMQKLSGALKDAFYANGSQAGARIRLMDPARPDSHSSQAEMLNACRAALALLTLAAEFAAGPQWELTTHGRPTRNFKFPDPPAANQPAAEDASGAEEEADESPDRPRG